VTSGPIVTDKGDSDGCAWGDFNNDGLLDLYVCNWTTTDWLYRNRGNGAFERVTNAGLGELNAVSVGCAWAISTTTGGLTSSLPDAAAGGMPCIATG